MSKHILSIIKMSKVLKYTIQDFNAITFNGFNLSLPEDTIKIISPSLPISNSHMKLLVHFVKILL